jgi:hypothetical protein
MKLVLLTVATHKHRECTHMGSATTRAYVQRASMTSGGLGSLRSRRLVVSPLILALVLSPQVVVPHQVRLAAAQVAQLAVLVPRQFLVGVRAPLQHLQDLILREAVVPPPLGGHEVAHRFPPRRCVESVDLRWLGLTVDQRDRALLVPPDLGRRDDVGLHA